MCVLLKQGRKARGLRGSVTVPFTFEIVFVCVRVHVFMCMCFFVFVCLCVCVCVCVCVCGSPLGQRAGRRPLPRLWVRSASASLPGGEPCQVAAGPVGLCQTNTHLQSPTELFTPEERELFTPEE